MTIVPRKSDIFETNSQSAPVEYLIDVHPDLLTDRSLPRLFKYRGFDEKYKRKKGNIEESGIVHSSIHSSKIVHYYPLISSSASSFFHSRRTFDVDLVKEQRRDKCTLLGSLIENDHDGRSLRTKILLYPTRVSPFQRLSVFLKYLPSVGLLGIFVGRLRKASSLCNVACDTF